jgi:hypothetical protein
LVVTEEVVFLSTLVTVTLAFGIGAPEPSKTVPAMLPYTACAHAVPPASRPVTTNKTAAGNCDLSRNERLRERSEKRR